MTHRAMDAVREMLAEKIIFDLTKKECFLRKKDHWFAFFLV